MLLPLMSIRQGIFFIIELGLQQKADNSCIVFYFLFDITCHLLASLISNLIRNKILSDIKHLHYFAI